jgi:hypothetical protein
MHWCSAGWLWRWAADRGHPQRSSSDSGVHSIRPIALFLLVASTVLTTIPFASALSDVGSYV